MKRSLLVLLAFLIVALGVFGPYLDNTFLMDDEIQVTANSHVQNISEWPSYFTSSTMDSGGRGQMHGIYYKPLMTLYFASLWAVFGNDPVAFRVPLLLMHVFSSFFIFLFLRRFFDWRLALGTGLLFVVHPINSEIVAYVADAQDALYMFFGMLGLVTFLAIKRTWFACLVLALTTMAALLGKETGALFLAIIPIAALLFDQKKFWPAMGTVVAVFGIYMAMRINSGLMNVDNKVLLIHQATYLERLMTIPLITWHYIEIFFVPIRISLISDFALHEITFVDFWLPLAGVIATLASLIFLWKKLERGKGWNFSVQQRLFIFASWMLVLWFFLHSSILIPLDGTYADRWFYIGAFAGLLLVCLTIDRFGLMEGKRRKVLVALTGLVALLFSVRTVIRLQDWEKPMELYQREFAQRPYDTLMANNVGYEYFHQGNLKKAQEMFERATINNPLWDVGWNNLGATYQHQGDLNRALELYKKSVDLGTYHLAYENYAALLCNRSLDNECRAFVKHAIDVFPYNAKLREFEKIVFR